MDYYSNCLLEAIKAKIKDPNVRLIYISPSKNDVFCPHLMWADRDRNTVKDFHTDKMLKGLSILWFKGHIRTRPYAVYKRWKQTGRWR